VLSGLTAGRLTGWPVEEIVGAKIFKIIYQIKYVFVMFNKGTVLL